MKSELLNRVFFEELLGLEEWSEVINALEQTVYSRDVEEGMLKAPGVGGVEEGLRRSTVKSFRKVIRIVDADAKDLVRVLLGRWDVLNLKSVLRGKHVGAGSQEIIDSLVAAGELDEALLLDLVKRGDIKACIDVMATWRVPYYRPLIAAWPEYARNKNLVVLELALDHYYYEEALTELAGGRFGFESLSVQLVKEVLMREIDFVNLMTVLRLPRDQMTPDEIEKYLIDGGKELSIKRLKELATRKNHEDIIDAVRDTKYHAALAAGLEQFFKTGALSVIERHMEEYIIQKCVAMFRADPLSVGLIIGYIWAKFNEIVNLRIIVRGKALGMPEERIREGLVLV